MRTGRVEGMAIQPLVVHVADDEYLSAGTDGISPQFIKQP
jgi:hypothetical protein